MKIQVSELLVKYMERIGIDTIFGMPGAHILPVYDSLFDSTIQSVLAKHEQGASFMAGGYARASDKIGACITKGKSKGQLAEECADLFILLIGTAISADFDLQQAFWDKMDKIQKRESRMVNGRIRVSEFRDM